jgi:hypothetical protein
MKRYWLLRALKIVPLVIIGVAAFGYVLMSLWNWLVPPIIGWKAIGYWQALGLFVLARVIFGFGGHGRHMHWRGRMAERWERMTPEEREKFREGMRARCGHHGAPPEATGSA